MLSGGIILGIFLCILGGVGLSIQNANKPVEMLENDSEDDVAKKPPHLSRYPIGNRYRVPLPSPSRRMPVLNAGEKGNLIDCAFSFINLI